jgi:dienelactone hydrolase
MPWLAALPGPTGPHALGTASLRVRGKAEDGRNCTITVQLWYPIDGSQALPLRSASQFVYKLRHPTWAPALHGAAPARAAGRLPLIVYVPDASGRHDENTFMLANLTSHGFTLAAIHDPFRERTALFDLAGSRPRAQGASDRIARGARTASMLLDALEELETGGSTVWAGRLDLTKVGIMGFALGGGVAAEATHADGRYVAAANLAGPISARLVTVPYLVMLSELAPSNTVTNAHAPKHARDLLFHRRARHQAALPKSHIMEIDGARREHFSDRLSSRWPLSVRRPAPVHRRIRTIIDAYTVAFFSTYLQNSKHPLLCVSHSPYPEVQFATGTSSRTHRAPAARQ